MAFSSKDLVLPVEIRETRIFCQAVRSLGRPGRPGKELGDGWVD